MTPHARLGRPVRIEGERVPRRQHADVAIARPQSIGGAPAREKRNQHLGIERPGDLRMRERGAEHVGHDDRARAFRHVEQPDAQPVTSAKKRLFAWIPDHERVLASQVVRASTAPSCVRGTGQFGGSRRGVLVQPLPQPMRPLEQHRA
jgi:hypothetical protein